MIFIKNFKFKKKKFHFILFRLIFLCYYCCSINLKRQSEHSGFRPDTSSLVKFYNPISNVGLRNSGFFQSKDYPLDALELMLILLF